MLCSTVSSLAGSIRSSAYFTLQITYPISKPSTPSTAYLVRYSLCKFDTISDKQHPCLTAFAIFKLFASPWSSCTLAVWSTYNLLINRLLCQLIPVSFRICINLVQVTWSNASASLWSQHTIIHLHSKVVQIISQHPNCIPTSFISSKSQLIFSMYIFIFSSIFLQSISLLSLLYVPWGWLCNGWCTL